jgi:histidinol-phosphatase
MNIDLTFLEETIREAGKITLKYFNKPGLLIDTKSNETPVTQADRESEQFIRERIEQYYPDDSIVGEEFGEKKGSNARTWILDPLDGTKTFITGVPLYGTMIALEEDGEIVQGAVYMPALDELVIAGRGTGCFWNGSTCNVSSIDKLEDAKIMTTDDLRLRGVIGHERHHEIFENVKLARTWGDCYGHILVATGRADAMLDPKMAIWDMAPFPVIIEEAGGKWSDFHGREDVRGGSLLSCNSALFEPLLGMVVIDQPTI